ncbi:MAG: phosphoribosylglycinamide formyltransferase [Bacteroidota bacterium]
MSNSYDFKSKTPKIRLAICASGRGSNARAIIDFALKNDVAYEVALIISNNSKADVAKLAAENNIPFAHISSVKFPDYTEYSAQFLKVLKDEKIEMIALAGFMKKIPQSVIEAFKNRIFNIHPALLPKFGGEGMYGIFTHEAVLKSGETETGVTIHRVEGEYDSGEILAQEKVLVFKNDTAETLAARVLKVEHELYPRIIDRQAAALLSASA